MATLWVCGYACVCVERRQRGNTRGKHLPITVGSRSNMTLLNLVILLILVLLLLLLLSFDRCNNHVSYGDDIGHSCCSSCGICTVAYYQLHVNYHSWQHVSLVVNSLSSLLTAKHPIHCCKVRANRQHYHGNREKNKLCND